MTTSTANQVRVNGVTLYYEEHGTGTPILCVHGAGSSALLWADAVTELAGLGRVIAYDRRGCTRSERPVPYATTSVRQHTDDAAALLEALGAAPAVVIGRSYGGEIGVDLVQRYPDLVRALVLLEPSMPAASTQMRAWLDAVSAQALAAARRGPAAVVDVVFREVFGDDTWEGLPETVRQIIADNVSALLAELNGEWCTPDAHALRQVTQPVLIVSGEDSPPPFRAADQALAAMIPVSRVEVVPGGHLINPAAPLVLDFLRSVNGR